MDWTDTGYSYHVEVSVVSQVNVDETFGVLQGILLSGLTISENYYSDSRVQGKVTTVVAEGESDGYIENARLRITLSIPDRDWSEEMMTGYVSDIDENVENGMTKRTYSIEGTIWGLLEHKIKSPIIIGKGATLINAWCKILDFNTKMQHTHKDAMDHNFGSNIIYEAGSALSTVLFELSSGYDRMDVDGHGRITLSKYTAPSKRSSIGFLDMHDAKGLSLYPLSKSSSKWEAPGRAIVTATKTVTSDGKSSQQVIVGSYDAPASHFTSLSSRGWLKAKTDSYNGSSENPSVSELNSIAEKNWKDSLDVGLSWNMPSVFKNYHAGEIYDFVLPSAKGTVGIESHKVLITGVNTNFESMTQELSFKEV